MESHSLARLLQDAEALAEHAVRHGRLPADSRVFELVAALHAQPAPPNATQLVAELAQQVDALVKAVRPVTLFMLTWHRSLRAFVTRAVLAVMPFAIGFLTLVLTCYLAFQSSQLNQADMALRSYYEWVGQQPREKLYAAFKLFHYERVLNVTQPPLEQLDAYQKLVDDAQELAKKGAAIQNMLLEASTLHYVPQSIENAAPAALKSWFARINAVVPEAAVQAADLPAVPRLDGPGSAGAAPLADPRCTLAQRAGPMRTSLGSAGGRRPAPALSYEEGWSCFLRQVQLNPNQLNYSQWPTIYQTQIKINMVVTWLLPGLYGLLGACVYVMRRMIVTRDALPRDGGILNALSLLLRIALGGLAGIIIGWFWVPTGGGAGALPQISSIPFGIAFLAGFSIETLFSLLDKLNGSLLSREAKKEGN